MTDLTGSVVTMIRDDLAVAAITKRVRGGELLANDVAPAVKIVKLSNSRSPFGRGHGRLGLQRPRFAANCMAKTHTDAAQLAGAVSDAIHQKGGRVISERTLHRSYDEGWGGPVIDPATGWVTETVVFSVVGSA